MKYDTLSHSDAYNIPPTKVTYGQDLDHTKCFLRLNLIGEPWDICSAYLWQNGCKILEHILLLIFYALSSFSPKLGHCKHPLCHKQSFREMCRNYRFGLKLFFIKLVMLTNCMAQQKPAVTLVSLGQVTRAWGRYILSSSIYSCVMEDTKGLDYHYSIHVPGWLLKWLNLITAPGSVCNEPGSVTWLATKYLETVSWINHTEKLTTL